MYMHALCSERNNALWASDSVTAIFISLWKLVSCICVEGKTFCYAYHLIHKSCVLQVYLTIAV